MLSTDRMLIGNDYRNLAARRRVKTKLDISSIQVIPIQLNKFYHWIQTIGKIVPFPSILSLQ